MWKPDSAEEFTTGPGPKSRYYTVVGVVGNVRTTGLTEKEPVGTYYFPFAQDVGRGMTLVTRTAGDPSSIVGSDPRSRSRAIDPELPFFAVKPMQQRVDESLVSRRTPMLLATLFGGIALFLAAVGIYGVLAFQVAQRRKEIGIRMALGSDGRRIFGLIVTGGALAARRSASASASPARSRSARRWRRSCSACSRWIRWCSPPSPASSASSRSSPAPSPRDARARIDPLVA